MVPNNQVRLLRKPGTPIVDKDERILVHDLYNQILYVARNSQWLKKWQEGRAELTAFGLLGRIDDKTAIYLWRGDETKDSPLFGELICTSAPPRNAVIQKSRYSFNFQPGVPEVFYEMLGSGIHPLYEFVGDNYITIF